MRSGLIYAKGLQLVFYRILAAGVGTVSNNRLMKLYHTLCLVSIGTGQKDLIQLHRRPLCSGSRIDQGSLLLQCLVRSPLIAKTRTAKFSSCILRTMLGIYTTVQIRIEFRISFLDILLYPNKLYSVATSKHSKPLLTETYIDIVTFCL